MSEARQVVDCNSIVMPDGYEVETPVRRTFFAWLTGKQPVWELKVTRRDTCSRVVGGKSVMIDLENDICFAGTVSSRGMESVKMLNRLNQNCGFFWQNDIQIVVYKDSTERELMYQYEFKRIQKRYGSA